MAQTMSYGGHLNYYFAFRAPLGEQTLLISVTRWLDYFPTFGQLHHWKLAQSHTKFATYQKVGLKFSHIGNKPSKMPKTLRILPKWWNFAQSDHTASGTRDPRFKSISTYYVVSICVGIFRFKDPASPESSSSSCGVWRKVRRRYACSCFALVIYDSRVVPDLKIPHITTLES